MSIIHDYKSIAEVLKLWNGKKSNPNRITCEKCSDDGWVQNMMYGYAYGYDKCPKCNNPNEKRPPSAK